MPWKSLESKFTFLLSSFWFSGPSEEYGCFPVNPQSIFGNRGWKVHNRCSTVPPSNIVLGGEGGEGPRSQRQEAWGRLSRLALLWEKKKGASLLGAGHHDMQSRDLGSKPQIWTLIFLWLRNTPYLFRDFLSLSAERDKRGMNNALPPLKLVVLCVLSI